MDAAPSVGNGATGGGVLFGNRVSADVIKLIRD